MVLGNTDGSALSWFSRDRGILVTRHGRVVQSAGFVQNVKNTRFLDDDPLAAGPVREPVTARRQVDIEPGDLFGIVLTCTITPEGSQDIETPGAHHQTERLREHCKAPLIGWSFDNQFWQDPRTGYVWKSIQTLVPSQPPLTLTTGRPPAT